MIYPVGVQSFEKLRREGCVYVDKTMYVWKLARQVSPIFLSRPRRFGKSLLLSTLEAYFSGKKELFEGLAIYGLEKEWNQYPVFHFDFNSVKTDTTTGLDELIDWQLSRYEKIWDVVCADKWNFPIRLSNLLIAARDKTSRECVILVDEYNKMLLNSESDKLLQDKYKTTLKPFYGVIKSMDSYIKFSMITGVGRYGKVSIFSDLNNLRDISLDAEFSAICGISDAEVEEYFSSSIKDYARANDLGIGETKKLLRNHYDGYCFSKPKISEKVYNPFSLMSAFVSNSSEDYWFETGTPTFVIDDLIAGNFRFSELNDLDATRSELLGVNEVGRSPVTTLFQTGYLTIKSYYPDTNTYRLGFPNMEVEKAFDTFSLKVINSEGNAPFSIDKIRADILNGKPEDFMIRLRSFFKDFPYGQIPSLELHYNNVLYLVFKLLGYYTHTERQTSDGCIDMLVETRKYIYLFEFKLNLNADKALAQIENKEYAIPYQVDGRKVFKIGVNFSSKSRGISDWKIETD